MEKKEKDAFAMTMLVMVESVQVLIILALVFSFIPMTLPDFYKDLPPNLASQARPKRDAFFYHFFVVFALMAQAGLAWWFQTAKASFNRRFFIRMAVVDGFLVALELFAVFKIWQWDNPWWARDLLYGAIGLWLLSKIFWVEWQQTSKIISEVMMKKRETLKWCLDAAVGVLLVACLWVPDAQKALGRAFEWGQFQNWDSSIMLPGWAYLHGMGLNTDIISPWGMGAVIFISRLAQGLGAFDYAHVLKSLLLMVIVYYGFLYAFVRVWLASSLLAAAAVAVAVKLQMFHTGISPLIWIFPQDTAVRHWLDIPVLWCLWRHADTSQSKYLAWGAAGVGVALAWSFSVGLCLWLALAGYLVFLTAASELHVLTLAAFKDIRRRVLLCLVPLAVMVLMLVLLQGATVFRVSFWKDLFEPISLFLQGVGVPSFYLCLYDRHFFAFAASFVIPVIYAWSLIAAASLVASKKFPRQDAFVVFLCLYGLGLYVHYLAHASISHYYAAGLPVVLVTGFWVSKALSALSTDRRLKALLLLAAGAWGALFTNIIFIYYPNVFNISRMDWNPEVDYYHAHSSFDADASMIARLTPSGQGAAVISSFETQMLIEAKRKPFFYDAPLVISAPMDTSGFMGTSLMTQQRLIDTITQIVRQAPEHIFIERKLLGQWPQEYVQHYPGIIMALQYIVQHYAPQEQGQYLIAMRKK